MKYIYLGKYIVQHLLVLVLMFFGDAQKLNEVFYDKTSNYFTKPRDVQEAFKIYLKNNEIKEKPYFLKNGFQLKTEFKMSVIDLSDEELQKIYPVSKKDKVNT